MSIAERRREKVEERVKRELQPGESIEATLAFAQTGPTPLLQVLTYLAWFWIRLKAIVATNQRVLVVKRSTWLNRVQDVEAAYARNDVSVVEYRPPRVWGKLRLGLRGSPLKLNIHRIHAKQAEQLVNVLGGAIPPPPVGPPPTAT
jgi:hypothetical protein